MIVAVVVMMMMECIESIDTICLVRSVVVVVDVRYEWYDTM